MDCSLPTALSMGVPRQEYWSGLSFSSPGHFPDVGIKPTSPASQEFVLCSKMYIFVVIQMSMSSDQVRKGKMKIKRIYLELNHLEGKHKQRRERV